MKGMFKTEQIQAMSFHVCMRTENEWWDLLRQQNRTAVD